MHYSTSQKLEILNLETKIATAEQTIQEFRKHLTSDKFHKDTTIQIGDVERWLLYILNNIRGLQ